jgi:hypothetical protein
MSGSVRPSDRGNLQGPGDRGPDRSTAHSGGRLAENTTKASEVRKVARNVGQAIQSAMRTIETANSDKLYGIFGDAQYGCAGKLPPASGPPWMA